MLQFRFIRYLANRNAAQACFKWYFLIRHFLACPIPTINPMIQDKINAADLKGI